MGTNSPFDAVAKRKETNAHCQKSWHDENYNWYHVSLGSNQRSMNFSKNPLHTLTYTNDLWFLLFQSMFIWDADVTDLFLILCAVRMSSTFCTFNMFSYSILWSIETSNSHADVTHLVLGLFFQFGHGCGDVGFFCALCKSIVCPVLTKFVSFSFQQANNLPGPQFSNVSST